MKPKGNSGLRHVLCKRSVLLFILCTLCVGGIIFVAKDATVFHMGPPAPQSMADKRTSSFLYDAAASTAQTTRRPDVAPATHMGKFRRQFLLWDLYNSPELGRDVAENGSKYFIYRCDMDQMSSCGGWADRLKGAMVGYMIANLTGRVFKAEFLKPQCDISNYLVPNRVNWSLPTSFSPNKTEYRVVKHVDNQNFKRTIHSVNFTQKFDPKWKYIYFVANLENISGLKKSPLYAKELSWTKDLTPSDIYAAIYKRLFKLSPRLQNRLQKILFYTMLKENDKLICVHVRMGRNPSINVDSEVRNSMKNLPKIWAFVANRSVSEHDKVFVMSDAQDVLNSAASQSFKDRLVTIPGTILHVDKVGGHTKEAACEGFEKLLLEHHMLMNCDVLVRGHSGLSVIASQIRATDKDLFCLQRNGAIVPCERNDFSTFL